MPPRAKPKTIRSADGSHSVRGKSANGEGSVFPLEVRGRAVWRATYVDRAGRRKMVQGSTRAEVLKRRDAAVARDVAGDRPGGFSAGSTLADVAEHWLTMVAPGEVRASSLVEYRRRVARFGALGDMAASRVTVEDVQRWQAELLATLSPSTVGDVRWCLRRVFAEAVTLGLRDGARFPNPVEKVKPPREVAVRPRVALEPNDVVKLVDAAASERLGGVLAVLHLVGVRVSEALGMAWSDLDLDAGTWTLRRAAVEVKGRGVELSRPKTIGAHGVHHLPPRVVSMLRARRVAQAAERLAAGELWQRPTFDGAPVDLVWSTQTGGVVRRQAIDRLHRDVAKRVGIDPTSLGTHAGRRSLVTNAYRAGEAIDDIARLVGHARPATTVGYVRDLGERPKRVAERVAALYETGATEST
jgi:integrase